jgi:hypothetical protein
MFIETLVEDPVSAPRGTKRDFDSLADFGEIGLRLRSTDFGEIGLRLQCSPTSPKSGF